jgi:formylglycine-generating enzyme required for sulfatase activity
MNTSILLRHAFLVFYAMFLHLGPNVLAAETWAATGSMSTSRANHTATLLTNGKVLVVGGGGYGGSGTSYNILAKAELFNPSISSWTQTGELSTARFGHTATLLSSGKVLVVGGFINDSSTSTASAELYDPTTAAWTSAGSLTSARGLHTATLLPNGKVLVVGGYVGTDLASAEIYDPATGTWTPTGSLGTARYYHSATLLPNGKVLVAGGGGTMLSSAELYDSTSGTWAPASSMSVPHRDHTATLLPNGKVLVTGGGGTLPISRICELYDPLANSWTQTGDLINGRSGSFTAILLSTGKVLVVGGWDGYNTISASELYDPILGIWTATGANIALRHGHAATLMLNGKILAQGGSDNTAGNTIDSAEIYDPGTLVIALAQSPHGNITGNANHYLPGSMALLTAAASPGYIFGSWSGDASGSTNPTTVLMDADKTVGVNFVEDSRDYDNDGLTNFQEIITYSTDSTLADTDGDGINDGAEVAQGRSPKTSEPVVTNLIGTQRQGTKLVDISYDLSSLTPTVKVTLEISSDGSLTYNVPVASATGAIGNAVTVGSGKTIVWNAGADWDGNFSNQMRFRLVTDDLQVPGFSLIPAGAFTMGRTSGDTDTNAPPVNVTVSQFYMGKYEVTKAEWDQVRTWAVNNGYTDLATGVGKASDHPVLTVSWWDVIKWCNARSQKEGLTPCYTVSGSVMKTGTTAPTVNLTANGYRLPTEAEWEKSARGGVNGKRFAWGEDTISHTNTNFYNNGGGEAYQFGTTGYHPTYATGSMPYTSPVGSFVANGYGLHDMAGNVWEWCWDWYGASTYVNNATDPCGAASGSKRVIRGGGWADGANFCRVAARYDFTPSFHLYSLGFRVARSVTIEEGNTSAVSSQDIVVDVRDFNLSIIPMTNGAVVGAGSYLSGISPNLTATPQLGYLFGAWTGDASGSANPTTVLMDSDKTVGATFVEDTRDPDSDGLTNYQEIIVRLTNPNVADSDSDGVNDGQEITDATNPLVADTDDDGLNDGEEKTRSTNPLVTDTDGDGYSDSYEVNNDADPRKDTSFPTYILTLANNGTVTGGTFAKTGTLAHGTNATVTATPLSGYLFGSWSGAASGSNNPNTVLMNSNKALGATFVEDTRDPDSDGLTNYQEIIVRLTNPNVADSESDGVHDGQEITDATNPLVADTDDDGLSDGEEKTRSTNPLAKDTDGDGLSDWEEEIRSKTNPLLADTDGDSISDALEDTDNDGISNLREVTELKTDPLLVDTDADGISDTYELVYKGSVAAFAPRIGDRLRFELRELVPQGTLKLVGALPTGLSFNAVTGVLEGKLTGKPGVVKLSIQVLNGKTVLRTIPLQFTVLAFPSGLIGTWQVLLEDANGSPQGMITTLISSPGVWSAQYDSLGTKTLRSSKGVFDLTPSVDRAAIAISFPVVSLTPAFSSSWQIDATTALAAGSYAQGTLRGFRLAKTGELPTASRQITMVIDQGEQDGYQIPAGLGWATGTLGTTGSLPLSGQLGDAQSLKTTVRLSATGQAMFWVKPYRNLNSLIGGIISLRDTGIVPQSPYTSIRNGLSWHRVADNAELSYSSGFGPLAADASVNLHNKPTSSLVFSANLGLSNSEFRNVVFDGGGLPSAEQFTAMPERFVMDSTYKLNPVALPGRVMALWQGGINSTAGSFTGTIALDASNSGILKGNASVSGVVFRRNDLETVGAGLIKIPTTGLKGSFRTGAFLMDR